MEIHPMGTALIYADRWTDGYDEANWSCLRLC